MRKHLEGDDFITDYINGYELRGDNGDYTPNERERFLIEDCIRGIVEEKEFLLYLKARKP